MRFGNRLGSVALNCWPKDIRKSSQGALKIKIESLEQKAKYKVCGRKSKI